MSVKEAIIFGFGKKSIAGSAAAAEFVQHTHDWANKTFGSFKGDLVAKLSNAMPLPGVTNEPTRGWQSVKVLYFVSLLTLETSTIRVVFPERQYTPMINLIGVAIESWELSHGKKPTLRQFFFDDMLRIEAGLKNIAQGPQYSPPSIVAEELMRVSGFITTDFQLNPITQLMFVDSGLLLLHYQANWWRALSEGYRLKP